jgi:septal ring factor EnvC (AmiA/AmiB activator)
MDKLGHLREAIAALYHEDPEYLQEVATDWLAAQQREEEQLENTRRLAQQIEDIKLDAIAARHEEATDLAT